MLRSLILLISSIAVSNALAKQGLQTSTAVLVELSQSQKELSAADLKQQKILSALYGINKKIKQLVTIKSKNAQQRSFSEMQIQSLNEKVEALSSRAKVRRALLAERLRGIYKLSGSSIARFILTSNSSSSLEANLKILGIIAAHDLDLIKSLQRDRLELEQQKHLLAQKLLSLKSIDENLALREQELFKEQQKKNKFLEAIKANKVLAKSRIESLRKKAHEMNMEDTGVIDALFKPSFSDFKGQLPAPLSGSVIKKFGITKASGHQYAISHKGVFISASKGSPVKSIFDGRVSFIGEIPGFGTTLILDHGDHYYTVYSHAQAVNVKTGQEVKQSHVLAQVGDGARQGSPGIYFEIRHFSEPYDPQQWMKGL
jgi:septal ring factor EnvC (AmiA/AmiB activator)